MTTSNARRPAKRRSTRAFTLLEMIAVVSIMGMVLTSVAVTLHSLNQINRSIRDEVPHSLSLTRVALQLREDAHASSEAVVDSPSLLRLLRPDGSHVDYEAKPPGLTRRVFRDEQQAHQEFYQLANTSSLRWDSGSPGLIQLRIERQVGAMGDSPDAKRVDLISAAVGLRVLPQRRGEP